MSLRAIFVAILLAATGLAVMGLRIHKFQASITPEYQSGIWQVESHITAECAKGAVSIKAQIPPGQQGARVLEESFRSGDFAAGVVYRDGIRRVVWTGTASQKTPEELYYFVELEAGIHGLKMPPEVLMQMPTVQSAITASRQPLARRMIERIKKKGLSEREQVREMTSCLLDATCAEGDLLGTRRSSARSSARALAAMLNSAGFRALPARGFFAERAQSGVKFVYWVRAYRANRWTNIRVGIGPSFDFSQVLFWGYDVGSLIASDGCSNVEVTYSLLPSSLNDFKEIGHSDKPLEYGWSLISFNALPISMQAVFRLLLLIPLGALVVVLLRSVVGIATFGTFMPVLVALAFRETGLFWGIALFVFTVFAGLTMRGMLNRLQLLLVPRLAATLSLVVVLILIISRISFEYEFHGGLSITLFPIVIITMIIERMWIIWEERGPMIALLQCGNTIVAAIAAYFAITTPYTAYLFFTFPELVLVVLACTILLGRFTGYRLTELYRFRSFLRRRSKP